MQNIAIIDHVGNKAGMDYYSNLLAIGFKENKTTPIVISNFFTNESGIEYHPVFIGHTNSKLKKGVNHILAFIKAAIICKKSKCSTVIVHAFSYELKDLYAYGVLKMFGLNVITILHDIENLGQSNSAFFQKLLIHRFADKIMVHNNFSYSSLMKAYGEFAKSKTKIIPHGNFHNLVPKGKEKEEIRQKLNLQTGKKYLLFFGQIKEVKGLDVLLKAMPKMSDDIHLIIAGKPWKSNFDKYQLLIDELGIQKRVIKFIKFIEGDLRDDLFLAADLLVLPYKKIFQSGVLLMGMSYKLPMVVSDLEPMRELIIDGETGYVFEEGNESELSNTISDALSSPEGLGAVKERAWRIANEQYSWTLIAKKIIDW